MMVVASGEKTPPPEDDSRGSTESERLFQEFLRRIKSGEKVDPLEYFTKYPELEDDLRMLFDALKHGKEMGAKGIDKDQVLGDFKVIGEIGHGAMGIVYEAEQQSIGRHVALKVLYQHMRLSNSAVQRFKREAEAIGRLNHSGIVSIYAVGEQDGIHYIAQELVSGGFTLADNFEKLNSDKSTLQDPSYYKQLAELMMKLTEALQHTHASGVIHRDVKPNNILLTDKGMPKLTDFGLAMVEDALALSRTGHFSGTPYYMSPEQAMAKRMGIDNRTDIFSLGATLYEALTLSRPFSGDSSPEVLKKVVMYDPQDPMRANPKVPQDLAVICMKALEKNPDKRYASMEEFGKDLRRFLCGEVILAQPVGLGKKLCRRMKRNAAICITGAVAVMAVAALIVTLLFKIGDISGTRPSGPDFKNHTKFWIEESQENYPLKIATVSPDRQPVPFETLSVFIRNEIELYKDIIRVVPDPDMADWLIVVGNEGVGEEAVEEKDIWLEPQGEVLGYNRFEINPEGLIYDLRRIFRTWALTRIAYSEEYSSLPEGFELNVSKISYGEEKPQRQQNKCTFRPGDQVQVFLSNNSDAILDVTLLYINADYGMDCLFPYPDNKHETPRLFTLAEKVVVPFNSSKDDFSPLHDRPLGIEHLLVIAYPREKDSALINLSKFAQNPLTYTLRGEDDECDEIEYLYGLRDHGFRLRGLPDPSTQDEPEPENQDRPKPMIYLFTFCTEWPKIQPPSDWLDGTAIRRPETSNKPLQAPAPGIPDPWDIGTNVYLASSSSEQRFDVLMAGNERPTQILFNEDAPTIAEDDNIEAITRDFEAEAAFHFEATRRIAYYDKNNDGEFDLILVDNDQDPAADIRYVIRDRVWKEEKNIDMPWFSTGYLAYISLDDSVRINRAVRQFNFLTGNTEAPVQGD